MRRRPDSTAEATNVKQTRRPGRLNWQVWTAILGLGVVLVSLILLSPDPEQAAYAESTVSAPSQATATSRITPTKLSPTPNGQVLMTITPQLPVATQSQVKLTVQPGLAGYARPGNWIPVIVDLDNPGPNADGELVINVAPQTANNNYGSSYQTQTQAYTTLYVQPVKMPTGSKKQVTMYVPFTGGLFNRTIIVDYNGQLAGDSQTKNLATSVNLVDVLSNNLLVGVFSTTPDRFATRSDLTLPNLNPGAVSGKGAPTGSSSNNITHLNFVTLDPAHLPDISQSLDSLNVIMLQDYDLTTFKPNQWQAIEAWVNSGGILLLSGGAGAERALKNLPPALAPVSAIKNSDLAGLDATTQAGLEKLGGQSLPGLAAGGNTLIARLNPNAKATPMLNLGNAGPLAVGMTSGNGAIVMAGLDLGDQRLLDWDGVDKLWAALLRPYLLSSQVFSSYNLYGINSAYQSNAFYGALTNIPGLAIPSLKIIGVLALIYILLVGPISYFALKILKRRELAWVVLPLITIIFGGGIYLFALKDKGTELITSSVAVVRLPDSPSATSIRPVLQMMGVFAPKDSSYTVDMQPGTLLRGLDQPQYLPPPPQPQYGQAPLPTPTPLPIPPVGLRIAQHEQNSQIDLVGMKQWTFRSVMAEGSVRLDGNLDSDLAEISDYITGTVTNRTGHPLSDVLVLAAYGYQKVGDLAVGQTVSVNFKNSFGQAIAADGLYLNPAYRGGQISNPTAEQRTEQRKQTVLQNVGGILPTGLTNNGYYGAYGRYGPQHDNNALAIMAWSNQPLLDYTVNQHKIGGNDLTLFISTPPLNLGRSNELLPGYLQGTVSNVNSQPSTLNANNTNQSQQAAFSGIGTPLEVGSVTVDFNLSQFGPNGVLRQAGKQPTELIISNQVFAPTTNYSQPKSIKYQTEIYNWKTGSWEVVPTYIAPPVCLEGLPSYMGGVVTPTLQILQALNSPGNPPTISCKPAPPGNGGVGVVTATAALVKTITATASKSTPGSATPALVKATATPAAIVVAPGGGYNPGGQNLSFNVLGDGPNFRLSDYINAAGEVKVRYTRDNSNTDQLIFANFSIGYLTK